MTHIAPAAYGLWAIMSVLVSPDRSADLEDKPADWYILTRLHTAFRILWVPPVALRQIQMLEVWFSVTQIMWSQTGSQVVGIGRWDNPRSGVFKRFMTVSPRLIPPPRLVDLTVLRSIHIYYRCLR